MSNIIQVVNQHAKLLDTIGQELVRVPRKNEIGEMFDILSHTFHFDKILKCNNFDPAQPIPRSSFIVDQLIKKGMKTNLIY
jgi:hypothetical protein